MRKQRREASHPDRVCRLVRRVSFAILVLLLPVIASAAPWYEHYALAEDAMAQKNWSEAVTQLNEAIQRRGDSGAHIRSYGMKVISYFPYLKLGIAYHNLGQYEAAIQAFETEERLGAIRDSPEDLAVLQSYREAATAAKTGEADRLDQERQRIVSEGLRNAKQLQGQGKIDDALREISRVLAVMPDNEDASQLRERLQADAAKRDREDRERQQLATLVRDGRAALEAGNYDIAASLLSQAAGRFDQTPGLERPADLDSLLATAQERLRAELERESASDRDAAIATLLEDVRGLERAGDLEGALAKIQRALALDPSNAAARQLQTKLLDQREKDSLQASIEQLTGEMKQAFSNGLYEESLGAANRILALDSSNPVALDHVRQAYVALGRRLLGGGLSGNLPPAIRFADYRETREDGSRVQIVTSPDFRVSGIAIDSAEPTLSFFDENDQPLEGSVQTQVIGDYHIAEFSVSLTLRPGTTRIRVAAKDPEGLASSSEYSVTFRPPLVDRLWFRALLTALVVAAFVGPFMIRRQRQARLRTRRFNPFVAGAPVLSEELFFGREQLVRRILQTVHNNSLLLHGERRIGKTSLQHHLRKRLLALQDPTYQFYPVLIDLQGVSEERFFATLIEEIEEQLDETLGRTERTESHPREAYSYREFVADLRAVLNTLRDATRKQVKLVLLIDEVDELNDYDPRVNQRLRSLFMKSFAENLVAIVSGVQIKKDWEREASPWYNFFEEIEVTPFAREDVEALVTRPIAGVLEVEDGLVDRIIAVTGGRPYLIQRLCISLVNHAYEEGRRVITLADIDVIGLPEAS